MLFSRFVRINYRHMKRAMSKLFSHRGMAIAEFHVTI